MGTVFSIYKRKPKQRYELGKHFHGFRPGLEPRGLKAHLRQIKTLTRLVHASYIEKPLDMEKLSKLQAEMLELTDPGWAAIWSIMNNPNYAVFKMSQWTVEELADKLYRGAQNIQTRDQATLAAQHLIDWAGDDDVTLNPEEPEELAELGWPTRGYRLTGTIWDTMMETPDV